MNLYPLHRPSPPAAQQQQSNTTTTRTTPADAVYSDKEQWRQATTTSNQLRPSTTSETEDLRKALLRAEAHASHWEKETRKMDKLARDAHDKLDAKKQVRKALKAELASVKEEADKWRARYKELSCSHASKATTDSITDERITRALKEAQASEQSLKVKLQQTENELSAHNRERPIIQERLQVGGNAFRKLQALEPKAKADELLAQRLTEETGQLKEKLRAASMEIATLRAGAAKAQQLEVEVATLRPGAARAKQLEVEAAMLRTGAAKAKQLEIEVATLRSGRQAELEATKEKLRAATNEVSASAGKVQACADMLTRAEQVLKTCSQLHAAKGESHALVRALTETTTNIAQFLQAVTTTNK